MLLCELTAYPQPCYCILLRGQRQPRLRKESVHHTISPFSFPCGTPLDVLLRLSSSSPDEHRYY
uniref:Uncharacterized protein n=1 Tax=Anguilla anguilla TaxID=7936 RepID=A0A0E9X1C2_ANGAN